MASEETTGYRCHGCKNLIKSEPYLVLQSETGYRVYHTGCWEGYDGE